MDAPTKRPTVVVLVRLGAVLLAAAERWYEGRQTIPKSHIAQALGMRPSLLTALAADTTTTLYFPALARLCWYFGTSLDGGMLLLAPASPADRRGPLPIPSIGRPAPPTDAPPADLALTDRITAIISAVGVAEVARRTGLTYQGVTYLLDNSAERVRLQKDTLAALCTGLQQPIRAFLEAPAWKE